MTCASIASVAVLPAVSASPMGEPALFLGCGVVVVDSRGDLLMVREGDRALNGRWSIPAGRVEPGETLVETAQREACEEAGVGVEITDVLGVYRSIRTREDSHGLTIVFRARVVDGRPAPTPGHPEVRFVPRSEVAELVAADACRSAVLMRAVLADLDDDRHWPLDLVHHLDRDPA